MDELVVGQEVCVNGGFGPIVGRVSWIEPPCIYVETRNDQLRFNREGKECSPNGTAYTYAFNVMFGPGPWEIVSDRARGGPPLQAPQCPEP